MVRGDGQGDGPTKRQRTQAGRQKRPPIGLLVGLRRAPPSGGGDQGGGWVDSNRFRSLVRQLPRNPSRATTEDQYSWAGSAQVTRVEGCLAALANQAQRRRPSQAIPGTH